MEQNNTDKKYPSTVYLCACGNKKVRCAKMCQACWYALKRPPTDPLIYYDNERRPYRRVPSSQKLYVLVSACRYDEVMQHMWSASFSREVNGYYFYATIDGKMVGLHRFLKGNPLGKFVDHHNHDLFDCRDENLRVVTFVQSAYNRRKYSHSQQKYKGVRCYRKQDSSGGWRGRVFYEGKYHYTRSCTTDSEAAIERNKLVLKLHGEFGYLEEIMLEEKDSYATTTAMAVGS